MQLLEKIIVAILFHVFAQESPGTHHSKTWTPMLIEAEEQNTDAQAQVNGCASSRYTCTMEQYLARKREERGAHAWMNPQVFCSFIIHYEREVIPRQKWPVFAQGRWPRRREEAEWRGSENLLGIAWCRFDGGNGFTRAHIPTCGKLFSFNMCNLLHFNYNSIKLLHAHTAKACVSGEKYM